MVVAERHIHQLRLSGASSQAIRRGAILLEDAFRTASFPSEPGRVVLIRTLNLGRISSRSSSARLAMLIEQRVREIAYTAVELTSPLAASACAVYYNDETEALLLLARKLATHQDFTAWFWPHILPEVERVSTLSALFDVVTKRVIGGGVDELVLVLGWIARLHEEQILDTVLATLSPAAGEELLHRFRWVAPASPIVRAHHPDHVASLAALTPWYPTLNRWIAKWGATDPRTIWLVAVAVGSVYPAHLGTPALLQRSQRVIEQVLVEQAALPPPTAATIDQPATPVPPVEPAAVDYREPLPLSDSERILEQTGLGDVSEPEASSEVRSGRVYPTTLAGLFFLINVLRYMQIEPFLEQSPAWIDRQLAARIFQVVARRFDLPLDDSAMRVLIGDLSALPLSLHAFIAPESWRDLADILVPWRIVPQTDGWSVLMDAGDLVLMVWPGGADDLLANVGDLIGNQTVLVTTEMEPEQSSANLELPAIWVTALARWCALHLDMAVTDVLWRPAYFVATRTHIDVIFEHEQVDTRLRRTGLDFDPNWVAWLGRVILFHYE